MSKISATTGYDGQLWLDQEFENKSFSHSWDTHTVTFNEHGFRISTEFELTEEQIVQLAGSLAEEDPATPTPWQTLPAELHRLIQRMASQILDGASKADDCLRKLPKGLRLAPLKIRERRSPYGLVFPVIYWQFSKAEKKLLKPVFEKLGPAAVDSYKDGLEIPMPADFERRPVHLTEREIEQVKGYLEKPASHEPFRKLYSIALDNYLNRYYDSAVMILATSIETALKWWLVNNSDPISEYILTNVQSPPIDKLYSCARKNTNIVLPKHFNAWLVQLRNTRNDVVHKHEGTKINFLELARWFAIGEAILGALVGHKIDPLIGGIVVTKGERTSDKLHQNSIGVVVRNEIHDQDNSYLILLESGETRSLDESEFQKSEEQSFQKITPAYI